MDNQLSGAFTFWYQKFQKTESTDFKNTLHSVATLSTPQEFWNYYQHLKRPSQLEDGNFCLYLGSYLYLFRKGIKPIWEDKANLNGGSFVILTEKPRANKMWEDVLLAFITAKEVAAPINGIRLKIKKDVAHIDVKIL